MKQIDDYITGRSQEAPERSDSEQALLAAENRALAELAAISPPAPQRSASLSGAYAKVRDHRENTNMNSLTRMLQGRPWYVQFGAAALLLLLIAAVASLLPRLGAHKDGGLGLSPSVAWAASDEFALVFGEDAVAEVHTNAEELHAKLMAAGNEWAREMAEARDLDTTQAPLGRFIEISDAGSMRVFLVFRGASRAEIEELQSRLDGILGKPLTTIEETTMLFPEGVPPIESGIAHAVSNEIFLIPGEADDKEAHEKLIEWLKSRGIKVGHGEQGDSESAAE